MKIYTFFSGDTNYFTTSKSLVKAQKLGKEVYAHYLATCEYLGEKSNFSKKEAKGYFIPLEVEEVSLEDFKRFKNDSDCFVLDEKLENL